MFNKEAHVRTADHLWVEERSEDGAGGGLRGERVHLDLSVDADGEQPRELDALERDAAFQAVHGHTPLAVQVALALHSRQCALASLVLVLVCEAAF